MKQVLTVILMVIVTISYSQRHVGWIVASDLENDPITFVEIDQRPELGAFAVTPDGELYVSDEEILIAGEWEIDIEVQDETLPEPIEGWNWATMHITVHPAILPPGIDTTIIDSLTCYKYEVLSLDTTIIQVIDSTLNEIITLDSVLIPAYYEYFNDTSYVMEYDTTTIIEVDTTRFIFTPKCDYDIDTIPPAK